jgi:hypothetical protein
MAATAASQRRVSSVVLIEFNLMQTIVVRLYGIVEFGNDLYTVSYDHQRNCKNISPGVGFSMDG